MHCALNEAARGVRSVLQVERGKRRCVASATRNAAAGVSYPDGIALDPPAAGRFAALIDFAVLVIV